MMLGCFSNSKVKVYVGYNLFFWAVYHFFHSSLLVFTLCSLFYNLGLSILFSIDSTSGSVRVDENQMLPCLDEFAI